MIKIIIVIHLTNYLRFLLKRLNFDKLDLLSDLSVSHGDGTWLSNSANFNLYKILKKIKGFKNSHFVDLGCGKGGSLYLVACFFKGNKITGYERDLNAVKICMENVKPFTQIEVICSDVKNININSSMNFFYMYNPFGIETMTSVLDNIISSIKKYPREIFILYRNPLENNIIIAKGFRLERTYLVKKIKGKRHWFYESCHNEKINLYKFDKIF